MGNAMACQKGDPGAKCPNAETMKPVSLIDGQISLTTTDVSSGGFGQGWAHTRAYDNQIATPTDFGNGYNWHVRQWSYLTQSGDTIILHRSASDIQFFDFISGSYRGRFGILDRLEAVTGGFKWIGTNGTVELYEDFSAGVLSGKLLSRAAPAADTIELDYDVAGHVTSAVRAVMLGTVEVTEEFLYTYGSGDHADRITSVLLRRREDDASWLDIRRALYTYYDDEAADGTLGDLKTVVHELPGPGIGWREVGTYYYRYYVSGEAGGFIHGLKYALEPAAFARAQAAVGDPLLASDDQLAPFANYFYEYDEQFRVVKELAEGGTLQYLLSYYTNPANIANGANVWRRRTTVVEPDGSTLIAYLNHIGQNMLHDRWSADQQQRWVTYWQFDSSLYSETLRAEPSAVNMSASPIYDEASADLAVQLRSGDGLITLYEYYNGTDGPKGYTKFRKIKKGTGGTPIKQREAQFGTQTAGGVMVYPQTLDRVWSDDAGTLAIDTAYAYDFLSGTNRVQQRTTTLPVVSIGQNGSGVAPVQRMLFDEFGRLIWEQGPKGFVDYFEYDIVTGTRTKYVRDVDPAKLPLPTDPPYPETWTRPAGLPAPLHLITDYENDDLGRRTQTLGPEHEVDGQTVRTADWTVYRDADFERRTARGYAVVRRTSYDYVLVNPVSISQMDPGGNVLDEIQAARGCSCGSPIDAPVESSGRLTAVECFPQTSRTAWTHYQLDHAGRRIAKRAYHSLPACGSGEKGTHYDETVYGYDWAGRQNRVVSPGGTITRTVLDTLSRNVATWVGTNDWGATDADPGAGTYPPQPLPPPVIGFDPQSIPGLAFWGTGSFGPYQDAAGSIPATQSGDPVGCWKDRRNGSSLRFTQSDTAKRPTVATTPINGRRAVRLDQTSGQQFLTLPENLFSVDAATPVTLFVILRTINSGAGYERLLTTIDNDGDYGCGLQRSGSQGTDLLATFSQESFVVGLWVFDDTTSGFDSVRNVACVWNESVLYFYRNNSLKDQATITEPGILGAAANSNGWALGCEVRNGGTSDWCNAEVAEFLIFNRALTSGELSDLFAWAAETPPPAPPLAYLPRLANNMVPVSARTFTSSCGCNEPSTVTLFVDDDPANNRVTTFTLDFRNRTTDISGEESFYERRTYDNLDRIVQVDRHNGSPTSSNFVSREKTYFDNRNNVYMRERYGINTNGTVQTANKLTEKNWYDAADNLVKQSPMGAKEGRAFAKFTLDGDARQTAIYLGYYTGEQPESYADSITITLFDKIFEQILPTYDDNGNVVAIEHYNRFHNATGNGLLHAPDGLQPKARVSYSAAWFDGIGRGVVKANYGTNGNVAWSRPALPPAPSDDVLVTTSAYNSAGNRYRVVDPAGREGRQAFNALGTAILTVSNYVSIPLPHGAEPRTIGDCTATLAPASWTLHFAPGNDENVAVGFDFNADGFLVALIAYNPESGNQTTRYEYGVTLADSSIASNNLRRSAIYPDAVDSSDRLATTFNRQGQPTTRIDQNGTRHLLEYDRLGRLTADRVLEFGANIDSNVIAITNAYNSHGLVSSVTSIDAIDTVVNQISRTYDPFDLLNSESQSHAGPVAGGTPKVQYLFANASGTTNTIRPLTMTYPDGRTVTFSYGSSNGDDDLLARVSSIDDAANAQRVVYAYIGIGSFVRADYPEPSVRWDLITGSGNNPYAGVDRFGREIDALWRFYGGSPADRVRLKYGYDAANNRIWRRDSVAPPGHDERYTYDGLNQLIDMSRGELIEADSAIGDVSFAQSWNLDAVGNWMNFRQLNTALPAENLDQLRSSNAVNEITGITRRYGRLWNTPTYDRAGNTTTFPRLDDPSGSYEAIYDAWNRLVLLKDNGTVVGEYKYDGLHRRVTAAENDDVVRHSYYSEQWQLLEVRYDNEEDPARQFVWGLRYVDDLVLRDRDPDENGSLDERLYTLQDSNWNTVAIVNAAGNIQERYQYSAYGSRTYLDPTFTPISGSAFDWEILFCGYRLDDSKLYYVRNRYHHSGVGRWLRRDPIEYLGGSSLYAYVNGRPIVGHDPFGLKQSLISPTKAVVDDFSKSLRAWLGGGTKPPKLTLSAFTKGCQIKAQQPLVFGTKKLTRMLKEALDPFGLGLVQAGRVVSVSFSYELRDGIPEEEACDPKGLSIGPMCGLCCLKDDRTLKTFKKRLVVPYFVWAIQESSDAKSGGVDGKVIEANIGAERVETTYRQVAWGEIRSACSCDCPSFNDKWEEDSPPIAGVAECLPSFEVMLKEDD